MRAEYRTRFRDLFGRRAFENRRTSASDDTLFAEICGGMLALRKPTLHRSLYLEQATPSRLRHGNPALPQAAPFLCLPQRYQKNSRNLHSCGSSRVHLTLTWFRLVLETDLISTGCWWEMFRGSHW